MCDTPWVDTAFGDYRYVRIIKVTNIICNVLLPEMSSFRIVLLWYSLHVIFCSVHYMSRLPIPTLETGVDCDIKKKWRLHGTNGSLRLGEFNIFLLFVGPTRAINEACHALDLLFLVGLEVCNYSCSNPRGALVLIFGGVSRTSIEGMVLSPVGLLYCWYCWII